uniref:Uncharacterized protein n=1 Tax=Glossina brevipalpis TaxID=37001 RepID=A0A1A9W1I0_9MUSC
MKNYFIIFLGIALVFQHTLTSPVPVPEAVHAEEDEQLDEHNKLYKEVLQEFIDFTIKTSEDFLEFTLKVVEDIKKNDEFPDKDHRNHRHEQFAKVLEKVKSDESEQTLFNMYKLTEDILEAQKTLHEPKFLNEESIKLIEKYKLREFMDGICERYVKFYESFSKAVQVYTGELNETQKEQQQKLLDWSKDFDETKDILPKSEKFLNFFDFFKPCCAGIR